jgi:hypothetical protein
MELQKLAEMAEKETGEAQDKYVFLFSSNDFREWFCVVPRNSLK